MSLLLDALKQAEKAKRDAAPDSTLSVAPENPLSPIPDDDAGELTTGTSDTVSVQPSEAPPGNGGTLDPMPDSDADAVAATIPEGSSGDDQTKAPQGETHADPAAVPMASAPPAPDHFDQDPVTGAPPARSPPAAPESDGSLETALSDVTLDGQPDSASVAAEFAAQLAADDDAAGSEAPEEAPSEPDAVNTATAGQPPLSLAPEWVEESSSPDADPAALQAALNTLAASRARRQRRTWLTTASLSLMLLLMLGVGLWIYWRHPVAGQPTAAQPFAPYPLLAGVDQGEIAVTSPSPDPGLAGHDASGTDADTNDISLALARQPEAPAQGPVEQAPLVTAPAAPAEPIQSAPAVPEPQTGVTGGNGPATGITFTRRARSASPTQRMLAAGERALAAGDMAAASRHFQDLLDREPGHLGALLGLASVALLQGDTITAAAIYRRVLAIDPRQATAQAGLINTLGSTDSGARISQVKHLLAAQPNNAYLHFTLGSLYARTGDWGDAQHHFFAASAADGGNPVYAFNLAVALEHLGKQRLALTHYRRALAQVSPPFAGLIDRATLTSRIATLQREHP